MSCHIKRSLTTLIIALGALAWIRPAASWDWPVPASELRSGFLSLEQGLPSRGVMFQSVREPVRAAHSGRVTMQATRDRFAPGFVQPQGSYVVVSHGNGFKALYENFSPVPVSATLRTHDVIGQHSDTPVRFSVFDMIARAYANPLDLLPRRQSDNDPRIEAVFFTQQSVRRTAGPRITLERDSADVSLAARSGVLPEHTAVLPHEVEFAVGTLTYHVLTVDRLVPGVFAPDRDVPERTDGTEPEDEQTLVEAGGNVPLEARSPPPGEPSGSIDEAQLPGVAVREPASTTIEQAGSFLSAVDDDRLRPLSRESDLVTWPGGWRRASGLHDDSGALRVGTVIVGSRSINTGIILSDESGRRVRRNISIDPAPGG